MDKQKSSAADYIQNNLRMNISQASGKSLKEKPDLLENVISSNQLPEQAPRIEMQKIPLPDNQLNQLQFIAQRQSLREKEKLKQKQMREITQFSNAWKSESGIGIAIIEKISLIIHNYFKILPQLAKREQENDILIVYNKGLLEILDKFETHERRIINKLRSMQQFNIKIMKQLCHIKNKPFKPPEIKNQEPMFAKFTLNNFAFHKQEKSQVKIDQKYTQTLFDIFKKYLLKKNVDYLPLVQSKIEQLKQEKGVKQQQLVERDKLDSLVQLRSKIIFFQKNSKDIQQDQIFNLYELKATIREQLKNLQLYSPDMSWKEQQKQDNDEANFVRQVAKINASLNKMDENQLQNCLKAEKEIRKKLRKVRTKEQEKFLRACESVQSENIELSRDIIRFKEKISSLENQLNVMKAEYDYKKMKIKPHLNRSSMIQQSIIQDEANMKSSNKKLVKQTHRAMNYDFKKIKQDNEKLQEIVAEYKGKQLSRAVIIPKLRQKAQKMELHLDPSWEEIKIIQFLLSHLAEIIKQKKEPSVIINNRDDELVSPNFDQRSLLGFQVNPVQYLNTIPEKSQLDPELLENRNKQLQKQVSDLRKKNEEYKNMVTGKSQDLRRVLQEHESTLKQKNGKINELVKQYERFQAQIKQLKLQNQVLLVKWECSQKLSEGLAKSIQQLGLSELCSKDQENIKFLATKLQNLNELFRTEIKKEEDNYEQKRQISLLRGGDDQISSKYGSNDQSIASLWTKNKEKRQSDMFSIQSKEDDQKQRPKIKNLKSLSNNNEGNYIESELQKELSLKKLMHKNSDKSKQKWKDKQQRSRDQKQKFKTLSGGKRERPGNKRKDKQSPMKKMDQFSIDQQENNLVEKKKEQKKQSATQIGLLKIQVESRQKITRTQQGGSDEKGTKSISYQNKKSSSNSNSNSNQMNNKEEQNAKEMSNILSELENHHDIIDSISERPKQISKEEFKQQVKNKQRQDKKNKVSMNDALKGSGNLEMISSRKNRFNLLEEAKKNKDEGASFEKKQEKKRNSDKTNQIAQKKSQILADQRKKQEGQSKKQTLLGIGGNQHGNKLQKSIVLQNSRMKISFRMQSDQEIEESISQPIIRINNVTRKQSDSEEIIPKEPEKVEKIFEPGNSQIINEKSLSLDYSKDGSVGRQNPSTIQNNQLSQPVRNTNEHLLRSQTYERIAQITVEEHQRIMARIQKLGDMDDVLDFIELYNRYKQVLICLDEAEAHIRTIYMRYQKFVEDLAKKQQNSSYTVEEQLFYLKQLVEEQRNQIENFDKQCNENMKLNILKSESMIKQHLKMMRNQARLQKTKDLNQRRLFH